MVVLYEDMNLIAVDTETNKREFKASQPKKSCREEFIVALKEKKDRRATFIGAMRLTNIIGQVFALNPVLGVLESDSSKLRFSLYSWRSFYCYLSILAQGAMFFMCVLKLIQDYDTTLSASTPSVFYGTNFLVTVLFLRIATKWPKLCQYISKIEATDPITDTSLVKKCNVSCLLILFLAFVEHLLSDISGLAIAMACQPDTELYTAFTLQSFPWIWCYVDYHPVTALFGLFFNFQLTFNWNFSNVFVICLSWYLESRIQQINNRLNYMRGKHASSVFWRAMREDYSKATNLVRKIDDVISGVIFISFASNLFSICWQLLHVLEDGFRVEPVCGKSPEERPMMHGLEQVVYFGYSFFFLMGRSLAVSLIAARVHSASKVAAKALYDVPSSAYCVEVQRFIDQVHGDTVALTGLQFFNIKRGLVLSITGTIITYELVLMQFTGVSPTSTPPPPQIIVVTNNISATAIPTP